MTPGARPDSKSFPDDSQFVLEPSSTEKLLNEEDWERYVAESGLSREEAEALYEVFTQRKGGMAMLRQGQLDREKFLREFPQVRQELEERIGKLRAFAAKVDKVHKDCTITNVVASSTGAVSGLLTILGLSLAPVTAGAGLVLFATGMGLGTAAAVTNVSTSIVDYSNSSSAKAKASGLRATDSNKEKVAVEILQHNTRNVVSLTSKFVKLVQGIAKNVKALKLLKAKPLAAAEAKSFITGGAMSVGSAEKVEKAFAGTVLAMTKSAKIAGLATAGIGLLVDVVSLVKSSIHLHEGAKAESSEELWQEAQELETHLETLSKIHEILQEA